MLTLLCVTTPSQVLNDLPTVNIDLTVTISVIIALCAIISPIFTTLINNCHQTKIKKLELTQKRYENIILHDREIYENYLRYAGRCIYYADHNALKDYGEYYLPALMLAPPDLRNDMMFANQLMYDDKWDAATIQFEKLVPKIQSILQTK